MPGTAIRYTSDPVKIRAGSVFVTKSETYQSHFPCVKQASDKSRHLKPSHGHAPMLLTSLHGFRFPTSGQTALTTPLLINNAITSRGNCQEFLFYLFVSVFNISLSSFSDFRPLCVPFCNNPQRPFQQGVQNFCYHKAACSL